MRKTPESPITLEELLKLKRHETPKQAFWERFDRDFENRRLRALMQEDEGSVLVAGWNWWRSLGWATGAMAALALAAVAIYRTPLARDALVGTSTPEASADVALIPEVASPAETMMEAPVMVAQVSAPEMASFRAEPRFVLDVIPAEFEEHHFRRVLANPAFLSAGQSGAHFVADALTSTNRSRTTFLVDRPVGQF